MPGTWLLLKRWPLAWWAFGGQGYVSHLAPRGLPGRHPARQGAGAALGLPCSWPWSSPALLPGGGALNSAQTAGPAPLSSTPGEWKSWVGSLGAAELSQVTRPLASRAKKPQAGGKHVCGGGAGPLPCHALSCPQDPSLQSLPGVTHLPFLKARNSKTLCTMDTMMVSASR